MRPRLGEGTEGRRRAGRAGGRGSGLGLRQLRAHGGGDGLGQTGGAGIGEVDVVGALPRGEAGHDDGVEIVHSDAELAHDADGGGVVGEFVAGNAALGFLRDRRGGGEDEFRAGAAEARDELAEVGLVDGDGSDLLALVRRDVLPGGVEVLEVVKAEVEMDDVPDLNLQVKNK